RPEHLRRSPVTPISVEGEGRAILVAVEQGEATEADPRNDTEAEIGTEAASPRAIAEMAAVLPSGNSNAQTAFAEAKPSGWATASRHIPSVAEALDRSDLPRMRVFHIFGIFAALSAIGMSVAL